MKLRRIQLPQLRSGLEALKARLRALRPFDKLLLTGSAVLLFAALLVLGWPAPPREAPASPAEAKTVARVVVPIMPAPAAPSPKETTVAAASTAAAIDSPLLTEAGAGGGVNDEMGSGATPEPAPAEASEAGAASGVTAAAPSASAAAASALPGVAAVVPAVTAPAAADASAVSALGPALAPAPAAPAAAVPNMAATAPASDVLTLSAAPDSALTEVTALGNLPRIAEDGRRPWQVYARPYKPIAGKPTIAVVVGGLGLSRVTTDQAIEKMPREVTLAFEPSGVTVGAWMVRARSQGHEALLNLPMEPFDYPRSDPGPNALLVSLDAVRTIERLNWALRQGVGYYGVTTLAGSYYSTRSDKMRVVLEEIRRRGLSYFEARPVPRSVGGELSRSLQVPLAEVSTRLDPVDDPRVFLRNLTTIETVAQRQGSAIALLERPTPLTLSLLGEWLLGLEAKGFQLAPASALILAPQVSAENPDASGADKATGKEAQD